MSHGAYSKNKIIAHLLHSHPVYVDPAAVALATAALGQKAILGSYPLAFTHL